MKPKLGSTIHPKRIAHICRQVRRNRLHYAEGCFIDWLRPSYSSTHVIALAYCKVGKEVIGIALWSNARYSPNAGVYVKRKYRGKGIGSKLAKLLKRRTREIGRSFKPSRKLGQLGKYRNTQRLAEHRWV